MQIPCGSRTACFSGYSGDSIRLFTAFWDLHTHGQTRTHTREQTHTLRAGRCHGYIKAETANFDQLLTVMEWDSGDTEKWWNKVLSSLPLFILIGSRDTISPVHRGTTSIHHWSSCMSTGTRAWSRVPNVIMRKLGDVAAHAFEIQYIGCPPGPYLIPSSHSFYIIQSGV